MNKMLINLLTGKHNLFKCTFTGFHLMRYRSRKYGRLLRQLESLLNGEQYLCPMLHRLFRCMPLFSCSYGNGGEQ